jgi:hypothetical protein
VEVIDLLREEGVIDHLKEVVVRFHLMEVGVRVHLKVAEAVYLMEEEVIFHQKVA